MLRAFSVLAVFAALSAVPARAAEIIYSPPNASQKMAFIRLNGVIKPGDAQLLEHSLRDAQSSGKELAVVLGSNDADMDEAIKIGRIIRKYHADTYHEYCAASCVLAFLGGERRFLMANDSGKALLMSRPEIGDVFVNEPSPQIKAQLDLVRAYVMEMTGDVRFYTTMMGVPFSSPHTIMPEEALATKTATQVLR